MSNSISENAAAQTATPRTGLKPNELASTTQATRVELGLAVVFTLVLLFGVVLLNAKLIGNITHDFLIVYTGASIVHQGNGSRLYDVREQARVQAGLLVGKPCLNCDRNTQAAWGRAQAALLRGKPLLVDNHPPFEALLFAPLSALSYGQAYVIWGAINIVIWLLCAYLIRPYTTVSTQMFQYLVLCFTFFPLWAALMQGQTSLLVLLSFTLTFICLKRQQSFRAGLCLGLGLLKFPIVLPFALICLLRRKWKLMAGFASIASFLAILSVIAVGPAGLLTYFRLLLDQARHPNTQEYGIRIGCMANVRALLSALLPRAFGSPSVSSAVAIVSALLIVGAAWAWDRLEREHGGAFELAFAAALVVSEVTAFHTLIHDLSPVLLAILLAVGACPAATKSTWRYGLPTTIVGLYVLPVYLLFASGGRAFWLLTPVLVGFAITVLMVLRKGAADSGAL